MLPLDYFAPCHCRHAEAAIDTRATAPQQRLRFDFRCRVAITLYADVTVISTLMPIFFARFRYCRRFVRSRATVVIRG